MREEAAAWVVRLSDPASGPTDRLAFEAWRNADPLHEAEYERAAAHWDELDRLRAFKTYGVEPDADLFGYTAGMRVKRVPRWRWAAVASFVLALGAGTFAADVISSPAYATGVGERRVIILKDGSRVELNTDSEVVVRYRWGRREVDLTRGEALFLVEKEARPFIVKANSATLRTDHSAVAVRLIGESATVTVQQGAVMFETVTPSVKAGSLKPGFQAIVGKNLKNVRAVSAEQIDRSLAWRNGAIALNGESLGQAAAEFNRYNATRIVVADQATAAIKIGGYFQTSDVPGFVNAVTKTFPVTASTGKGGVTVLSRRRQPAANKFRYP